LNKGAKYDGHTYQIFTFLHGWVNEAIIRQASRFIVATVETRYTIAFVILSLIEVSF
jgi:hypothetical protein